MRFLLIALLLLSTNAFAGRFVICDSGSCTIPTTGEEWVESDAKDGFYYIYEDGDEDILFEDFRGICHGKYVCYDWKEMDRKTAGGVSDD